MLSRRGRQHWRRHCLRLCGREARPGGELSDHAEAAARRKRVKLMDFKPIYIVDTLAVKPAQQIAMLTLLKEEGIPIMQDAGLELVGCYSTSPDLDEDVLIQVTWKVRDHSAFNLIRKEFVTDPRWWGYSARASQLRTGGTRRFFYPTPMRMTV